MQHHLILIREVDEQLSGSGCCGRVEGDLRGWVGEGDRCFFPERRVLMDRFGAVYRAVKAEFGDQVRISVVDPRNQISLVPMMVRDAFRYHVPALTVAQSVLSAGVCSAVLDGQLLFHREVPPVTQVLELIRGRLAIARVGARSARA
jgi:hypothetical protein